MYLLHWIDTYRGIVVQFQYCVSQFQTLADDLSKLYRSLFDADSSSLHYISLYPPHHDMMAAEVGWGCAL